MSTQTQTEIYQPKPGDLVMCDPTYTSKEQKEKKEPRLTIPARVIKVYNIMAYVEIQDEVSATSHKRDFSNTEIYGSTTYALNCAMQLKPVTV